MFKHLFFSFIIVAILVSGQVIAQDTASEKPSGTSETKPSASDIPEEKIAELQKLFVMPKDLSRAESVEWIGNQPWVIAEAGEKLCALYPNAKNLHVVRGIMQRGFYNALQTIQDAEKREKAIAKMMEIAETIVNSDAPLKAKLQPDSMIIMYRISKKEIPSEDIGKEALTIVDRYSSSDVGPEAVQVALNISSRGKEDILDELSEKLDAMKAPAEKKIKTDGMLTFYRIQKDKLAGEKAEKIIDEFIEKHSETDDAWSAVFAAAMMAGQLKDQEMLKKFADVLEEKYVDKPRVKAFLRGQLGRSLDVGKTFTAELTKLDGTKLNLPQDLLGKVVVIDFWATWCAPCVKSMPEIKELYAKYKDKGVEIVGISLDKPDDKENIEKFIKENGLEWIITYSGKGWDDPTTQKYGISGIPNLWVIGKDGKVVSDNARADLEGTIEKALAGETAEKK